MQRKKNKKGIIYTLCLVGIFATLIIGINAIKSEKGMGDNQTQKNNDNTIDNSVTTDNEDVKENNEKVHIDPSKYTSEIADADRPGNAVYHRGEYHGRADSREINPEFIIDECILRDYADGVEIEFLAYEEMSDISEYINKTGMINYEVKNFKSIGILNDDGTFNNVTQKIRVRLDDNVYGEETVIDNYEFIAVKLKVRLTNTQNCENKIYMDIQLDTAGLIYMDDGKLYDDSSVYNYDFLEATYSGQPIYHSFMKYFKEAANVIPTVLTLEPFEEIEGEIIYILGKQDLDNVYIICNPENCNIENFNGVYIQFLPFSLLKKLPSE